MPQYWDTIISVADLKDILLVGDVVVADCRFDLGDVLRGRREYLQGHIPGAQYVHLDDDLSDPVGNGSRGRHPLPSKDRTRRLLRRLGVTATTQLVAYDDKGGAIASRLWWMARWSGHSRVAVLDGGWSAWLEAGGAVEAGRAAEAGRAVEAGRAATPYTVPPHDDWLARFEDLDPTRRVFTPVDSRTADRFRGDSETIDVRAGHIPGALNLPFPENLDSEGRFLPSEMLRERFEQVYRKEHLEPAFYCGSGVTACHNILATQVAGLPMPRLFAPSWSGWISDPNRPAETGPGTEESNR